MKVRVCVPIPAKNLSDAFVMIKDAEKSGADLIEMRLDYMSHEILNIMNRLEEIVKHCSVPMIATNRDVKQGGKCVISEERRIETLIRAAESGFAYVDVELTAWRLKDIVDAVKAHGAKTIVSFHDFNSTPPIREMKRIVKAQIEAGADICKIITTAKNLKDSINCLLFASEISKDVELICFAMGKKGLLSRVLSPLFGASFTYASLKEDLETAPGQISIRNLKEIYGRLGVQS
ncbi:MAG: type I 3-dehydroquinate dehydratase [Candidatus Bathyarchaeia archaeon]|nr:type I 3-dehydroquinate dehydratase [Candidatus Bathyarchaeota archaeon]